MWSLWFWREHSQFETGMAFSKPPLIALPPGFPILLAVNTLKTSFNQCVNSTFLMFFVVGCESPEMHDAWCRIFQGAHRTEAVETSRRVSRMQQAEGLPWLWWFSVALHLLQVVFFERKCRSFGKTLAMTNALLYLIGASFIIVYRFW